METFHRHGNLAEILRERLATNKLARARFQKEARAIARLQHPSIVPIHEIGALPDGRPYYTMKEVVGRTLKDLIATASPDEGLTRRMLEALHRASEAARLRRPAVVPVERGSR